MSQHLALSPVQSTEKINQHVLDSVKILRTAGLPEDVIEFSYTHHGDQVVEYFYNQARKKEALVKRDAFRFRGMRPKTRETAVVMLIDSVKAASRTVSLPSRSGFEQMVSRIVQTKRLARQLDESSLTSSDLQ